MRDYRPLRPFFYKPVAIIGVPLFYWKLSLAATVALAILLFFVWRTAFGIPVWFVGSLGCGFGLVSFLLWAHNSHKRGWLEYSLRYYWRELTCGPDLLAARAGRKRTHWLLDGATRWPK